VVVCAECDLVRKLALNGRPSVMMRRVRAPRSQQESAERGAHNLLRIRFTECENTGEGKQGNEHSLRKHISRMNEWARLWRTMIVVGVLEADTPVTVTW